MLKLYFLYFSLCPLPLVLSLGATEVFGLIFFTSLPLLPVFICCQARSYSRFRMLVCWATESQFKLMPAGFLLGTMTIFKVLWEYT